MASEHTESVPSSPQCFSDSTAPNHSSSNTSTIFTATVLSLEPILSGGPSLCVEGLHLASRSVQKQPQPIENVPAEDDFLSPVVASHLDSRQTEPPDANVYGEQRKTNTRSGSASTRRNRTG